MHVFVFMDQKVRDFDIWKEAFDEHQAMRESFGAARHWLCRSAEDPLDVFVAVEFPTLEQAKDFAQDPVLAAAMREAGVEGRPRIAFREKTEVLDY